MAPNENEPSGDDDRSVVDKYYDSIRQPNPRKPIIKDPIDLDTPTYRYWIIFFATFVLTLLQVFMVPSNFDTFQDARVPMAIIAGINIFTMTGQVACIGIGAVYIARWIYGKPLKDLFND